MKSHFHGILFSHVARWSSGASITTTTSSQDKQTETYFMRKLSGEAHRMGMQGVESVAVKPNCTVFVCLDYVIAASNAFIKISSLSKAHTRTQIHTM